jgi:hypothetical protein
MHENVRNDKIDEINDLSCECSIYVLNYLM